MSKVFEWTKLGEIPDVCIFQARIGPMHPQQLSSLAKTKCDFNLIYRYGPGTAHENINHCLDRCTSRYVAICDDDVEFLDEGWLTTLLQVIQSKDNIGMVVPIEIKNEVQRNSYLEQGWNEVVPKPGYDTLELSWLPGFVMLFDLERVPEIRADEKIPGPSGMSDLDLSLQVRSAGFKCMLTSRTAVYHPEKSLDIDWRKKWDIVPEHELPELYRSQIQYMTEKWGGFFTEAIGRKARGFV